MANAGVWGIDIGQCGLKALRCELSEDGTTAVATAFDFIEYPMILSQPDADPSTLVREAFATFMSRNKLKGDRVAMSVSGQFGLTRFFGPPPCQIKQLPDLVLMDLEMPGVDGLELLERGRTLVAGTPAEVRDDSRVIAAYLGTFGSQEANRPEANRA